MRISYSKFILLLLVIVSCIPEKRTTDNNSTIPDSDLENKTNKSPVEYYNEKKLSFFDPYELVYDDGKYQGYTYEKWIRQPDNLRMIHETLKKIGYDKLISNYELTSNPCLLWGYVNRPLNHIIDSLVITYPLDTIETKYYREFWQRRKNEKNDEVVFEILQEVLMILLKDQKVSYNETLVNDTLYNLVIIDRL